MFLPEATHNPSPLRPTLDSLGPTPRSEARFQAIEKRLVDQGGAVPAPGSVAGRKSGAEADQNPNRKQWLLSGYITMID